ncbi:hypothetical protein KTS45_19425 [Halomicroarcula limicola]|uniref:Uncharacterized protein n=1 Tax=Haloarcula limicola TaxID=1429915 RepID=A0A8J8C5J1_9EURY|nr:hypothetical protein [Halomicroarcula limicola]MBV0926382.1 hypothetical protein [Halomicroarcula limicola]
MDEIADQRYRTWFEQRFKDTLDDLTDAADPGNDRNLQDEFDKSLTSHGNSEEKIARSHEGRELIELIQNARDAIELDGAGQVYVGILDDGILVANTGEAFDLFERSTERAVKMIGESNKTVEGESGVDLESDSIGHIGVGLKSTVAVGDDFEVWSKRTPDASPLRVRYSRAYITAAVLGVFGNTFPSDLDITTGSVGPFADRSDELFTPAEAFQTENQRPLDDLGKVPQFWFPWPLDPNKPGPSNPTLSKRAKDLLTDPSESFSGFETTPSEPFTTAVFIEYRDENWRALLEEFEIPTPIDTPETPATRADELWARLSYYGDQAAGFDPETLINLGKIDNLYIERLSAGETVEAEHWERTSKEPPHSLPVEKVSHRCFDVTISDNQGDKQTLHYDSFEAEWEEADATRPRVIVEQPRADAEGMARSSYPLHLYYPISSTVGSLPVSVHGRFRVTTERKDLSRSEAQHNLDVLGDAVRLLGHVGGGAATLANHPETASHWNRYPWLLLPTSNDASASSGAEPKDTPELLDWFRSRIVEELTQVDAIATRSETVSVTEAILYPTTTSLAALAASTEILKEPAPLEEGPALPVSGTLRAAHDRFTDTDGNPVDTDRLKEFIGRDRSEATLRAWTTWLNGALTRSPGDTKGGSETVWTVNQTHGRELFRGLVELIDASVTAIDTDMKALLEKDWLTDEEDGLTGVHILPCQRTRDDEKLDLVPIRPAPTGNLDRGEQAARTVFWGLDPEDLSVQYPPKHGTFDVFFLDRMVEGGTTTDVLEAAGGKARTWGVRKYNDFPDLFEAFLQTFKPVDRNLGFDSLAGLSQYMPEIATGSTSLSQTELSIAGRKTFLDAASDSNARHRLRVRLAVRRSKLDAPEIPNVPLSDLTLSRTWQSLRYRALHPDEKGESDVDETERESIETVDTDWDMNQVPDPESGWGSFPLDTTDPGVQSNLARTLSLLGVSSIPGVRYLPLHGDAHPELSGVPGWEPGMWDEAGQTEWIIHHRRSLQQAIEVTEYREVVTSEQYHPRSVFSHGSCAKAPTKPSHSHQQSYLIGWTWFEPNQLATLIDNAETVRQVLGRYSTSYQNQLLTTRWDCRRFSTTCSSREEDIPTVANLQLRQLPIWDGVVNITKTLQDKDVWETEEDRLDCAVIETGSGGRSGWRLFPYVDPDSSALHVDTELLETLGVVSLKEIELTGAEYRLQRVQAELVEGSDPLAESDEPRPLSIPRSQEGNWKRAYSLLLDPILDAWNGADTESGDDTLNQILSRATHLPIRKDGKWHAAPISWIRAHGGDSVWRYPERNPPRWVTSKLERANAGEPGYRVEWPATATGFAKFVEEALGVPEITATEPNLSFEAFTEQEEPIETRIAPNLLTEWTDTLENRLPLLLAVISTESDERLASATEQLRTAIDNIGLVRTLSEGVKNNLSNPKSITYDIGETGDQQGIALVKDEIKAMELSALSQGLALLLGQFTHLSRFRQILEAEEYGDAKRWFEGTLPVDTAEEFLDRRRRTNIRSRLELGASLLDAFSDTRPQVEEATLELETLSEEEDTRFHLLADEIRGDERSADLPEGLSEYISACRDVDPWLREAVALVIDPVTDTSATEGVEPLRDHFTEHTPGEHRGRLIEWLVSHRTQFPGALTTDRTHGQYRRLAAADSLWGKHESAFLETGTDWQQALDAQSHTHSLADALPEYADPAEHGMYWIELTKGERLLSLTDAFIDQLASELPDATASAVRSYIIDDTALPAETESTQNHKARAFAAASSELSDTELSGFEIMSGPGGIVQPGTTHSNTPGRRNDTGASTFTGRGEIAEVAVTLEILERTARWLSNGEGRMDALIKRFNRLYETQTSGRVSYQWHTKRQWNRELLSLLNEDADLLATEFRNWRSHVRDGKSLMALTPVSLLDVSGERGPGFDVIDPLKSSSGGQELYPQPLEIKSVTSVEPPFGIRLTTNEYQQCKRHIKESNHPYVIQLVYVPTEEPSVAASEGVGRYPIESVEDLEQLLGGATFDMQIRGGYLTSTFGQR